MLRLTVFVLAGCGSGLRALPTDTGEPAGTTDTGFDPTNENNGNGNGGNGNNAAPVADAGLDGTSNVGSVVLLDGSGSYDPDGDNLSYQWAFVSAPADSSTYLVNDARVDPSFYADAEGTYVVSLTVGDGLLSASDEVSIEVSAPNGAPIAAAGPDQAVTTGTTVALDGSSSWDPDGDALNYTWTMVTVPSGSSATLSSTTSPTPTFFADTTGRYEVSLVVDDGDTVSSADIVAITASAPSEDDSLCYAPAAARLAGGTSAGAPALALLPFVTLLVLRRRERRSAPE